MRGHASLRHNICFFCQCRAAHLRQTRGAHSGAHRSQSRGLRSSAVTSQDVEPHSASQHTENIYDPFSIRRISATKEGDGTPTRKTAQGTRSDNQSQSSRRAIASYNGGGFKHSPELEATTSGRKRDGDVAKHLFGPGAAPSGRGRPANNGASRASQALCEKETSQVKIQSGNPLLSSVPSSPPSAGKIASSPYDAPASPRWPSQEDTWASSEINAVPTPMQARLDEEDRSPGKRQREEWQRTGTAKGVEGERVVRQPEDVLKKEAQRKQQDRLAAEAYRLEVDRLFKDDPQAQGRSEDQITREGSQTGQKPKISTDDMTSAALFGSNTSSNDSVAERKPTLKVSPETAFNPVDAQPFNPDLVSGWKSFPKNNGRPRDALDVLQEQSGNTHDVQSRKSPRRMQSQENSPRFQSRKCFNCGETGHSTISCPNESANTAAQAGWRANANPRKDQLTSRATTTSSGANVPNSSWKLDQAPSTPAPLPSWESARSRGRQSTFSRLSDLDATDEDPKLTKPRRSGDFEDRKPRKSARQTSWDDEDLDDDRPRRRAGRASSIQDPFAEDYGAEFDERSTSRRRQREDVDDFGMDGGDGVRKIRAKRDREREEKRRKARRAAQRGAVLAERKANAMSKITLPDFITVSQLAQALGVRVDAFARKMEQMGFSSTAHDHVLSADNASLIALEYNFDATIGSEVTVSTKDLVARPVPDDMSGLSPRPPIVTIMGHVDHGKTTILDYLRKSSIVATEHGGITQHIGAFSVLMSGGKTVTFLDTPGHAAFLSMRKRGANVTDIVILVVAADDSVKPQTLEALKHAREANVPIIVALNKVDKPEADLQKAKQDLSRHGIEIEDFGGDVQVVPVSGKTGQGMDDLEEAVVTLGEILDHRAEATGDVEGWVLEATTKAAGRVATVLVRRGTLKPGDVIVAGQTWAKVKTLQNEAGMSVPEAGPGTPVEVDGWREQPMAGDLVLQAEGEQRATDVVSYRAEVLERQELAKDVDAINEARRIEQMKREKEKAEAAALEAGEATNETELEEELSGNPKQKTIPFIIKADVSGSAEAVDAYLQQLINPVCSPRILRSTVGPVSKFDVEHASAAKGHIITFNLAPPAPDIAAQAAAGGVKVLEQNVIYRIPEQVRAILEDSLEPLLTQRVTGEAEVVKNFDIGIGGRRQLRIAGCKVKNGEIKRGARVRVLRKGTKIYDGTIDSLKNVKKDVTEMRKGTECGIGFEDWTESDEGDFIQVYEEISEKRRIPV